MATEFSPDSVILVAGGSGLIGSKIVEQILNHDARVAILDINPPKCKAFEDFYYKSNSILTSDFLTETLNKIENEIGAITGLINCMSTRTDNKEEFFQNFESYSLETWDKVFTGNLRNSFLLNQNVVVRMKARWSGSIVNFGSIYSSDFGPDLRIYPTSQAERMTSPVSYSASKGGLVALTKFIASTYGEFGIRANSISPGGVFDGQSEEFVQAYSRRVPLGRMASVDEIANLPVFLVSSLASYISGQNIYVDGGLSSW